MSFAKPLSAPTRQRIALPFAIVTFLWGSTWIVIRGQLGNVPITWSVCYRFTSACLAMIVVARVTKASLRVSARDHLMLAGVGVSIFCLNFNFVYRAEAHVTSGLVAVTFALLVVYNSVLGRIFLKQRLSRPFMLGSGIALLGVALLFLHELRAAPLGSHEVVLGIGLTLLALLFASIANLMQATERARALPMPALLVWAMLYGALANATWAWIETGPPQIDWSPGYIGGALYLGILASALAFTLYFTLIRQIGPARAGYVNVLTPVLAMALSTVFEAYRWSLEAAAGGALVIAGLVVAMRARNPAR
jgi:drug/metabolite transporter (DMT)-like permease